MLPLNVGEDFLDSAGVFALVLGELLEVAFDFFLVPSVVGVGVEFLPGVGAAKFADVSDFLAELVRSRLQGLRG